jgi:hypothetical protein
LKNQKNIPKNAIKMIICALIEGMSVQERQSAAERQARSAVANEATAKKEFPYETWVGTDNLKLNHVSMPKDAAGILVARSRLPINKQEELDFLKEVISAIKLKNLGFSVTLIPRIKRPDGKGFLPGPDAIVNGSFFEFKTVTGKINKVGRRFAESRIQGNNVYIRVENPRHTKAGVEKELVRLIKDKNYSGGYKGIVVFTIGTGQEERTHFYRISDLKK